MEGQSPATEETTKMTATEKKKVKNHRIEGGESREEKKSNGGKNKKRKEFAPFGNYRNYYGYRVGQDLGEDPRLKVLKKEWFEGRDCLDVGCNNGLITINIAKKLFCRSILGIDIDSKRIEDAYWILRKFLRAEAADEAQSRNSKKEVAEKLSNDLQDINMSSEKSLRDNFVDHCPLEARDLSSIVSFRQENFVQSRHPMHESYDTIICLSVTKWVHLNWGDDGLITLFSRIWRLLRSGGIFVLEPQPWRSYEQNRLVSETTAKNYSAINIYPEQFQDILLDKIGFHTVEDLTSGLSGTKAGFNRPILAFRK
ncbi:hypothetical protein MLD38_006868 [Melastoma candidum]|uniref:Uncharacterized protein n=1 Tax=Melastoma candidum TaxID=119954 RepID=A0ACB9RSA6_9MYRT|nr:hypothetical protein MLD38_006868 [Melastoma candidum]